MERTIPITLSPPKIQVNRFKGIPFELWITILSYLNVKDLITSQLTCWTFYQISNTDVLWKALCIRAGIIKDPSKNAYKEKICTYRKTHPSLYQLIANIPILSAKKEGSVRAIAMHHLHSFSVLYKNGCVISFDRNKYQIFDKTKQKLPPTAAMLYVPSTNQNKTCEHLLSGDKSGTLHVESRNNYPHSSRVHKSTIVSILKPFPHQFLSASDKGVLKFWKFSPILFPASPLKLKCKSAVVTNIETKFITALSKTKIVFGTKTNELLILNLKNKMKEHICKLNLTESIGIAPIKNYLLAVGFPQKIEIWSLLDKMCIQRIRSNNIAFQTIQSSKDQQYLVVAKDDNSIQLWSFN